MAKEQTLTIMATLCALYGQGKGDPKIMAAAWHEILKEYDFERELKVPLFAFHWSLLSLGQLPTA